MIKLAPSILSADFARLGEDIDAAVRGGADYIHFDVMDGHFVPNISVGVPVLRSVKRISPLPLDVHLMISDPESYIDAFIRAGADILTIHEETAPPGRLGDLIARIASQGIRPSLCIKPKTPVERLRPFLKEVSMVLVMTVEPGFGGQALLPETLDKIKVLRTLINDLNPACELEVDGGICPENVRTVLSAGADVIVAGNAIFGKPDIAAAAREFKQIFEEYR